MVNLPNVAIAAVQPPKNNEEIFVWYQKHPGYATFARADITDARAGSVPTLYSADVEGPVVNSAEPDLQVAGGGSGENNDKLEPFASSWSFTKAELKTTVFVFGVRDADHKVCMISPTYEPLAKAEAFSYSVAACGVPKSHQNHNEDVLIYYLKEEKEGAGPQLAEYSLLRPKKKPVLLPVYPSENSRLCAYHNASENKEYCFYIPDRPKAIHWRESRRGGTSTIHGTQNVSAKSPMAICVYRTVPVLFYFNTGGDLMVTEYSQATWHDSRTVIPNGTDAFPPQAHHNSDLAAVGDTAGGNIILYYREKDSENDYDTWVWRDPKIKNA